VLDVRNNNWLFSVCWHKNFDSFVVIAVGALIERTLCATAGTSVSSPSRMGSRRGKASLITCERFGRRATSDTLLRRQPKLSEVHFWAPSSASSGHAALRLQSRPLRSSIERVREYGVVFEGPFFTQRKRSQ
jgi:hypothetical protein